MNIPIEALHLSKTRASLEGRTLSAVVGDALQDYAQGLGALLAKLGLAGPGKT